LLSYLQNRSTPILTTAIEGSVYGTVYSISDKSSYLINSFIKKLADTDPIGFEQIETIVKGHMLANALCFSDLGKIDKKIKNLEIYFDTNFLLRALGFCNEAMRDASRELLDILYELKVDLRCFEHTYREIAGVLGAIAHCLRDPRYHRQSSGETFDYFIQKNLTPSDAELEISRLKNSLRSLRVFIKEKPHYKKHLSIDELKLQEILKKEVHYSNDEALIHDLDSLISIHRLRDGRNYSEIETCKAIFITNNPKVAKASAKYFTEECGERNVLHCVLDHILTTVVWLKKPLEVKELPRKKIIADCYAALNPSNTLWKKYLDEINKLQKKDSISENDYFLLRYSMEARQLLLDLTVGDANTFTEGTVQEVLERARAEVRAEAEEACQEERNRRLEAEQTLTQSQTKFNAREVERNKKIKSFSVKIGRSLAIAIYVLSMMVIGFAIYISYPFTQPDFPPITTNIILPAILIILFVFSLCNLAFGLTMRTLIRKLEVRISKRFEKYIKDRLE
jgi:hypothetical protein